MRGLDSLGFLLRLIIFLSDFLEIEIRCEVVLVKVFFITFFFVGAFFVTGLCLGIFGDFFSMVRSFSSVNFWDHRFEWRWRLVFFFLMFVSVD